MSGSGPAILGVPRSRGRPPSTHPTPLDEVHLYAPLAPPAALRSPHAASGSGSGSGSSAAAGDAASSPHSASSQPARRLEDSDAPVYPRDALVLVQAGRGEAAGVLSPYAEAPDCAVRIDGAEWPSIARYVLGATAATEAGRAAVRGAASWEEAETAAEGVPRVCCDPAEVEVGLLVAAVRARVQQSKAFARALEESDPRPVYTPEIPQLAEVYMQVRSEQQMPDYVPVELFDNVAFYQEPGFTTEAFAAKLTHRLREHQKSGHCSTRRAPPPAAPAAAAAAAAASAATTPTTPDDGLLPRPAVPVHEKLFLGPAASAISADSFSDAASTAPPTLPPTPAAQQQQQQQAPPPVAAAAAEDEAARRCLDVATSFDELFACAEEGLRLRQHRCRARLRTKEAALQTKIEQFKLQLNARLPCSATALLDGVDESVRVLEADLAHITNETAATAKRLTTMVKGVNRVRDCCDLIDQFGLFDAVSSEEMQQYVRHLEQLRGLQRDAAERRKDREVRRRCRAIERRFERVCAGEESVCGGGGGGGGDSDSAEDSADDSDEESEEGGGCDDDDDAEADGGDLETSAVERLRDAAQRYALPTSFALGVYSSSLDSYASETKCVDSVARLKAFILDWPSSRPGVQNVYHYEAFLTRSLLLDFSTHQGALHKLFETLRGVAPEYEQHVVAAIAAAAAADSGQPATGAAAAAAAVTGADAGGASSEAGHTLVQAVKNPALLANRVLDAAAESARSSASGGGDVAGRPPPNTLTTPPLPPPQRQQPPPPPLDAASRRMVSELGARVELLFLLPMRRAACLLGQIGRGHTVSEHYVSTAFAQLEEVLEHMYGYSFAKRADAATLFAGTFQLQTIGRPSSGSAADESSIGTPKDMMSPLESPRGLGSPMYGHPARHHSPASPTAPVPKKMRVLLELFEAMMVREASVVARVIPNPSGVLQRIVDKYMQEYLLSVVEGALADSLEAVSNARRVQDTWQTFGNLKSFEEAGGILHSKKHGVPLSPRSEKVHDYVAGLPAESCALNEIVHRDLSRFCRRLHLLHRDTTRACVAVARVVPAVEATLRSHVGEIFADALRTYLVAEPMSLDACLASCPPILFGQPHGGCEDSGSPQPHQHQSTCVQLTVYVRTMMKESLDALERVCTLLSSSPKKESAVEQLHDILTTHVYKRIFLFVQSAASPAKEALRKGVGDSSGGSADGSGGSAGGGDAAWHTVSLEAVASALTVVEMLGSMTANTFAPHLSAQRLEALAAARTGKLRPLEALMGEAVGTAVSCAAVQSLALLAKHQKKDDFKASGKGGAAAAANFIELSSTPTPACQKFSACLRAQVAALVTHLSGSPETLQSAADLLFHLLEKGLKAHVKSHAVSDEGALRLKRDAAEYWAALEALPQKSAAASRFEVMREIANLFLVTPSCLRDLTSYGSRLAELPHDELVSFLKMRSDWKEVKERLRL
eukprot:Rhum_TRINITY_DN14814_c0_g1::Rhum_TRINITY_DN14814_c0_g1_i1::g.121573::m.121573